MSNNSHLTVYKASAGSGKTFRLAVQYITMLIQQPENYRHILAVTFTNKATAEMKQRILSQLYGISKGLETSKSYYDEVCKMVKKSEADIRKNAHTALNNILQDYGRFRVETIDSFFQTVLRSLARELNIGANLTLELDTESVIDEAVDSFLAGVEQGSKAQQGIMEFVEDNIENEKNWSIDSTLKKFSKELFRELFMEKGDELRNTLSKPEAMSKYRKRLIDTRDEILSKIINEIKKIGSEADNIISDSGISPDSFQATPIKEINKMVDGTIVYKKPGATFIKCESEPEQFFKKPAWTRDSSLLHFAQEKLCPRFSRVDELCQTYNRQSNSYKAALNYLYELNLLLSIRSEIDSQSQEKGRFILADTPRFLNQLSGSDTSFVFEKTGSFIHHMMIDEFQDTSRLQWSNLYLLLWECLSTNKDCLIVGDVKQAIYRFRNSDWELLNSVMEQKLAQYHPEEIPMKVNYRSHQNIITFNNELFPHAVNALYDYYKDETQHDHPSLKEAYKEVDQESKKADEKGYVYVRYDSKPPKDEKEKNEDKTYLQLVEQLDKLTEAGVKQTDITILCRYKSQIIQIAKWFAENNPKYRMISSEAFQLKSSVSVRILINALKWLTDNTDSIALSQLVLERDSHIVKSGESFDSLVDKGLVNCLPPKLSSQKDTLRNLPLYELMEKLYEILELDRIEGQDQYIMSLFDTVCMWLSKNPGEPSAFLKDWEEHLSVLSIPATDVDGIRLMTIHKAKGLEFHTVIIPYCNWEAVIYKDLYRDERIWADPTEEPFNGMPLLPLGFTKKLNESVFESDFRKEVGLQIVDNLNLMYVAFTRAVSNLIVLSSEKSSSMSEALVKALSKAFGCKPDQNGCYQYEKGDILPHEDNSGKSTDNPFERKPASESITLRSYPIKARFRQSGESVRFVNSADNEEDRQEEYIETGKLLHSIFAIIQTEADIDQAVDKMLSDGLIATDKKAQEIRKLIRDHIKQSDVSSWFDGNYALFNEVAILYRDGGAHLNKRPDRVMIRPDGTAIVVDFKFGRESEEYMHQVQMYMDLLKKMGYSKVEGHIWYVYNNKIINC